MTEIAESTTQNVASKVSVKMTVGIILAITFGLFALIAMRVDDWSRDWTQNYAELNEDAQRPEMRPVKLDTSPSEVIEKVKNWVERQPNWTWVTTQKYDPPTSGAPMKPGTSVAIQLTRQTGLFKFTDDVTVMLRKNDDGSVTMNATSQSRLGKGDLGQNPRNLVELVNGVR